MFVVAALIVSAASAGNPADEASGMATAIIKKGSSIKLFYKAPEQSTVRVTIYNSIGNLVYSETLKEVDGFMRPYNFDKMPYGDYRIVVNNGSSRRTEHVHYSLEGIAHMASMVRLEDGKKYLLVVPNRSDDRLTISVTNDRGDTLHTSKHELQGDFSTVLNVEDLDGNFTVTVMDSKGVSKSFNY